MKKFSSSLLTSKKRVLQKYLNKPRNDISNKNETRVYNMEIKKRKGIMILLIFLNSLFSFETIFHDTLHVIYLHVTYM